MITRRDKEKHGGARNYHLRRRYGITAEYADWLFAEQDGLCAICRERPAAHVDHDHETGRVRGLLCFNCNGALGQFRDRADLMAAGATYLMMGADAVRAHGAMSFAVTAPAGPSTRPADEDNAYLFEFLDEVGAASC